MPYLKGDLVMALGQVARSGEHGVVINTMKQDSRCLVRFEDGSEEVYDAGSLTLIESRSQSRIRAMAWDQDLTRHRLKSD
jgi:hypothetical protein